MARPLHLWFRKVHVKTVMAVRELVKAGFYRADDQQKVEMLNRLADTLSQTYRLETPKVAHNPNLFTTFGCYEPATGNITMRRVSLVTFLHEYRHHWQKANGRLLLPNREYDAQAWATSVFRRACPRMFRKAVEEGRVMGLKLQGDKVVNA